MGVDRVVHTSTSECYGTAIYVPIDEKHPLQGQSPYSASKIGADMIAESYWRSFELPVAIIRPFNAFGPRQSARAVIPTIISQALAGGPIRLGALTPTRDMNYVDNTVDGFVAVGTNPAAVGEVINIGNDEEISIVQLATLVKEMTGSASQIRYVPYDEAYGPGFEDTARRVPSVAKLERLVGFRPRTTLRDALTLVAQEMQPGFATPRTARSPT